MALFGERRQGLAIANDGVEDVAARSEPLSPFHGR
jgi:hypothetical protein